MCCERNNLKSNENKSDPSQKMFLIKECISKVSSFDFLAVSLTITILSLSLQKEFRLICKTSRI